LETLVRVADHPLDGYQRLAVTPPLCSYRNEPHPSARRWPQSGGILVSPDSQPSLVFQTNRPPAILCLFSVDQVEPLAPPSSLLLTIHGDINYVLRSMCSLEFASALRSRISSNSLCSSHLSIRGNWHCRIGGHWRRPSLSSAKHANGHRVYLVDRCLHRRLRE
jgi:hypothetical protein